MQNRDLHDPVVIQAEPVKRRIPVACRIVIAFAGLFCVLGIATGGYIWWCASLDSCVAVDGKVVPQHMLETYTGEMDTCANPYFRQFLEGDELLLYDAFHYAYQNPRAHVEIKCRYTDEEFERVLFYLKCDYAVLPVNTEGSVYMETSDPVIHLYPVGNVELPLVPSYDWMTITIPERERELVAKNLEAIGKAEEILDLLPPADSQFQQAKRIYEYLVQNVTYDTGEGGLPTECTAYGALVEGRAQCDGFAAANMMLCALSDIPNIRIFYDGANGAEGHTWNMVSMDGTYYHVDASGGENATRAWRDWCIQNDVSPMPEVIYTCFAMTEEEAMRNAEPLNHIFDGVLPACGGSEIWPLVYDIVVSDSNLDRFKSMLLDKITDPQKAYCISVKASDEMLCDLLFEKIRDGWFQEVLEEKEYYGTYSCYGFEDVLYLNLEPEE